MHSGPGGRKQNLEQKPQELLFLNGIAGRFWRKGNYDMKRFTGRLTWEGEARLHRLPPPELHDGIAVLWRGFIANRDELIREAKLENPSDGEIFAAAYRRWGDGLQARVLGEYAVAMYEHRTRTLLLTHDALGVMPLFYSYTADALTFSTHLEDLVETTGTGELDEEYIADYIAFGYDTGERTAYRSCRRLDLGKSLSWRNGRLGIRRTWDPSRIPPVRLASDAEYEERLRVLLDEAVRAALRTDGPVWADLSGGLDSSTVLATAARAGTADLHAISFLFDGFRPADERPWIDTFRARYPIPWKGIDARRNPWFSELPRGFVAEPSWSMGCAALYRAFETVVRDGGGEVILTGVGGDQVFVGDRPVGSFRLDHLRRRCAADPDRRSSLFWFLDAVLQPTVNYYLGRRSVRVNEMERLPDWIEPVYTARRNLQQRHRLLPYERCGSVGKQVYWDPVAGICRMAGKCNRLSNSLEFRHPLLYRPLVEFMFAVPWEQKFRPGEDRSLQRRALAGILPEKIRNRTGKGRPGEAMHLGLASQSAWIEPLTLRPRIVERGYVRLEPWRRAVALARQGCERAISQFLSAATLEIWLQGLESKGNERRTPCRTPSLTLPLSC